MSTTLMTSPAQAATQSVGTALRELTLATRSLALALWSAATRRNASLPTVENRTEAAAQVRKLAFTYLKSDPGYAADLFAAADYHERSAEA